MVDAAELDDVGEVEDDAFDELDEEDVFVLKLQAVATLNAAVNATATPKIRTTRMICLQSVTAILTALRPARQYGEADRLANSRCPWEPRSVVRRESSGSC